MKMAGFAVMAARHPCPLGLACLQSKTVSYIKTSMLYITIRTAPASALRAGDGPDRRTRGRSEEHTSELQSLMRISYAVFCLKKKTKQYHNSHIHSTLHHTIHHHT